MQKRSLYIGGIMGVCCMLSFTALALTNEQKGQIMDNFKQLEYEMIFESDTVFVNPKDKEALQLSDKVAAFAKIREVIMKKRKEVEEKKEKLGDKITSLEDSIAELDADIFNITKEANKTNASIIEIQDKMDSTKQQIDILSKKVEKNREVLLEYLEYLYKKGNFLYQDGTLDALRATLLSGDGFADLINDVYFTGIVELTGNKLISDHRNFIAALYIKKIDLEEDEVQLKQLRKSLMLSKKLLDDKKEFKERLLTLSRGQESTYTTYLEQKIDLEKKLKVKQFQEKIKFDKAREAILEKYNCEYIDTLSEKNLEGASEECIKMNKVIHIESTLESIKDDAEGDTLFSWPIFPYAGLSAYYHDEEYYHDFGSSHEAIDIIAPQGTDIAAPADGYVVYIQMPDTDGYAYIALKHADGFVTVYGHVNEVLVSELDFVKKGQVFARSGGEYGTPGAGLMTTGPHLHFEVFEDKQYVDPLKYLDTSFLPYSSLPEKYKYKFLEDFKIRKGYEFEKPDDGKVFFLEGATEVERQKSLLNKYATPEFRNWNMWVEESLDGGVDPSFVMCLGLAESGLGRFLKTPYNIGNVGNTDSGATWDLPNARSGVYRIVRTLNNDILSQYTEIRQLSRFGNKDGSIYASSPFNWHNNITKCMSHLKGEYVPDDYNFRLR